MEEITRRLLIIGVGSSACIHILPRVLSRNPEVLFQNEIMLIDTSSASLRAAVNQVTKAYQEWHSKKMGVIPQKDKTFPVNLMKRKISDNAVLIGGEGGGASPQNGLKIFEDNQDVVINKIDMLITESEIDGIVVIGCSGKGTATLTAPTLVKIIFDTFGRTGVFPLGILTLPFRFRPSDNANAKMSIDHIADYQIPMILLDYECALHAYMYLEGKRPRGPTTRVVYECVSKMIGDVLSVIIEALNMADRCDPPIDWSDLMKMYNLAGKVGTFAYGYARSEDEVKKKWKSDIENTIMLKTKSMPEETAGITILRSEAGFPMELTKTIGDYLRKSWKSPGHIIYELYTGGGYTIATVLFGFDPRDITPEVTPTSKGILHKLFGL